MSGQPAASLVVAGGLEVRRFGLGMFAANARLDSAVTSDHVDSLRSPAAPERFEAGRLLL
jgi:hypothetical protein